MDSAKILLVGGDAHVEALLLKPFEDAHRAVDIVHVQEADDALHDLVVGGFQLSLIVDRPKEPTFAVEICTDAREAGVRVPIIVLMLKPDLVVEQAILEAGGYVTLATEGPQNTMLRNLVNLTVDLRKTEETLRKSNDRLMMEMRTLQDERDRAEALSSEYVELMENYAHAKEELEKINQEKNKFFSIIAHDLRSPFTGLIGFSALLKDGAETYPPEKIKKFAGHIHKSSTSIFKLLENLLEWSRLQMNRVSVSPVSLALGETTLQVFNVLHAVAAEKGIELSESGTPPIVFADPPMVEAVIRNLINNAIKFTPQGGTIEVQYESDEDSNTATTRIIDSGIGMDSETAAKLFDITENVSTRGTEGEEGTGLGLLLCAELVTRNKGKITVESTPGKGSTFTFTLPLKGPEA